MAEWLDVPYVVSVLGGSLASDLDAGALEEAVAGTRDYVEGKRRDLFGTVADVSTFTPGESVRLGAAHLAHRFYARRTSPLGVLGFTEDGASGILREDPDIARLLGIGRHRGFRFGAGRPNTPVEVV